MDDGHSKSSKRRHRDVYGPDGMKLLNPKTIRRKEVALERALASERTGMGGELVAAILGLRSKRCAAPEPSNSTENPLSRSESDDVNSRDCGMPAAANAPLQADDSVEDADDASAEMELFPARPPSSMDTSDSDIWDNNGAASIITAASVSASECSDDVDSSDVDDPAPQRESSCSSSAESTDTDDDGAWSPERADFDRNNFTAEKVREYMCSGSGDTVMFPASNTKSWQVVLLILGMCSRFSLNGQCRRALIDFVKLLAGPEFNEWTISDYYSKIFDAPDEATMYHFYCEICFKELEMPVNRSSFRNHDTMCDPCSKTYSLALDGPNCFASIDLEYQILSLLQLKPVNEDLARNLGNLNPDVPRSPHLIRDVCDGSLYKNLLAETPRRSRLLTCAFNTDGAPFFKSSKRAFWPILLIINELSPRVRFKYPLLASMCVVRKEPSPDLMNTYMRPFVKALNRLSTVGFYAEVGGKEVHFLLKPLFCSVDSVARPLLQNRLQFNGYYGCSWCYSKGQHTNGCMRFLMEEPDAEERTHQQYVADVREATKRNRVMPGRMKKRHVRGVRGKSILQSLETFDMIWGFARDYLHADLYGVILQLINMFCDPNCPIKLTRKQMQGLNDRLMRMTPPREVHRLVRPLKTERCKWKASEWRSWLLFYAIPCLTGILDNYALQHLALYVNSIYTLLKTSITEAELQKAQDDLERFVIIFELLYGAKYVTFNVHTVKHVIDSVRSCGPLWATSTFPFESTIHHLKQCVQGPRGVSEQMTKGSIQRNVYRALFEDADVSPDAMEFQKSLFGRTEVASYNRCGSVVFTGNGFRYNGSAPQLENVPRDEIKAYKRCISSGMVIHSAASDKITKKSDDTVFLTDTGKYVQVLYLIEHRNTALAEVAYYAVEKVTVRCEDEHSLARPQIEDVTIDHLVRVVSSESQKVIRVTRLVEKCVIMRVAERETFISRMPNTIEIQ